MFFTGPRTRRFMFAGGLIVLVGCSSSTTPAPTVELDPVEARVNPAGALETITADEMLAHISYLASDELGGRDTPSPGLETAAVYLADAFAGSGLEPAGDKGSYLQRWTYEKSSLRTSDTGLSYETEDGQVELGYATDFFVLPSSDTVTTGQLVFLGPIEVLLEGVPEGAEGHIAVVTTPPSMGMEILSAVKGASEAGATGLVMILDPQLPPDVVGMVAGQITGAGLPLQPIPAVGVTWDVASAMLEAAGSNLDEISGLGEPDATVPPVKLDGSDITIRAPMDVETSTPPNVVGVLRGSDPELEDTFVVLSAHFDHLGIGTPNVEGDSIYNGADDDASGTSVLLEVAQAFEALPRPPARSVVFLAVSGEEKGLLGSGHYAEHPTVPLEGIVANINIDMIGRNAPDTVIAIGQEYTSLGPLSELIASHHPEIGLTVAPDPDPSEQAFFRSDHVVFVKQDIPAIFFTTWVHDDYHQPSDEAARIDSDKAARVARLTFLLTWHVAEDVEPPTWNEGALDEVHAILESSPF